MYIETDDCWNDVTSQILQTIYIEHDINIKCRLIAPAVRQEKQIVATTEFLATQLQRDINGS